MVKKAPCFFLLLLTKPKIAFAQLKLLLHQSIRVPTHNARSYRENRKFFPFKFCFRLMMFFKLLILHHVSY